MVKLNHIVSGFLVFALCFMCFPFNADATNIEDEILACLNEKYITQQSNYAISDDLDFSVINDKVKSISGYDVLWSSNSDAVTVQEEKGIVKRGTKSENVQITATVPQYGISKTFSLLVESIHSGIGISDNFYYPEYVGENLLETPLSSQGWAKSGDTEKFTVELTNQQGLRMERLVGDTNDITSGLNLRFNPSQYKADIKMELRISPDFDSNSEDNSSLFITLLGTTQNKTEERIAEIRINSRKNYYMFLASDCETGSVKEIGRISGLEGSFFDFAIDVDAEKGIYNVYVNGERLNERPIYFQTDETENRILKLSRMRMLPFRGLNNYEVYINQAAVIYPADDLLFSSPKFYLANGDTEQYINAPTTGMVRTKMKVDNLSDASKEPVLITAVYSSDKKVLKDVCLSSEQLEAGESAVLESTVQMNSGEEHRSFVLMGVDTLCPAPVPATAPGDIKNEFVYGENDKAGIKLSWSPSHCVVGNEVSGYAVFRNSELIAQLLETETEYIDYSADFFEENNYEICSVTDSNLLSDSSNTVSTAQERVKLLANEVTDEVTGRKYKYIDFFGENAIRDYYTTRNWSKDNTCFYFTDDKYRIFEYSIYDEEVKYIDQRFVCNSNPARDLMTVGKTTGSLYYVDSDRNVVRRNPDSKQKEQIAKLPENVWYCAFISVTDDETKLLLNWSENGTDAKRGRMPILDIPTGVWDTEFYDEFPNDPEAYAGNQVINPVNGDLVMYMKLKSGTEDRIWLLDKESNTSKSLYTSRLIETGAAADILCHECWTMDGQEIVVADYSPSPADFVDGVVAVDLTGKIRRINDSIAPTHVSCSPADNRWIVADTTSDSDGMTNITLIDGVTGGRHTLCHVKWAGAHPGHPHPSFSYDGNYVWFGLGDKDIDGLIRIGWMNVSDIVSKPVVGGEIELSESCSTVSYEGTSNYLKTETREGNQGYLLEAQHTNYMLVKVDDELLYGSATATNPDAGIDAEIKITYFDGTRYNEYGEQNFFNVLYFAWDDTADTLDKTRRKNERIDLMGTNTWVTTSIDVYNMNLENMELLESDLRLRAYRDGVLISKVEVIKK